MKSRWACVCMLLILCGSVLGQQSGVSSSTSSQIVVPRLIRFSGVLKDSIGKGMSGTAGVTFSLYKEQQGGAALWIESQNVQFDASGKYTVLLGTTKPDGVPLALFTSGEAQWLGVSFERQPGQTRIDSRYRALRR